MKFGYQQASHTFPKGAIFENIKQIALECEGLGYDSFWVMDHLMQIGLVGRQDEPIMEAYTTLAALASVTSKIRLGALATCNFFRNPALLAKMGATIDEISKGRFWLGIGAGWFQEEAKRYGFDFKSDMERLEMLSESLKIITMVWTRKSPTFHGKYYSIDRLVSSPQTVQKPRPPILVGGGGEKITLRLVAKYADSCNLFPSGEELKRKLGVLKKYCEIENRDYSSILKTKLSSVVFASNRTSALKILDSLKPSGMTIKEYSSSFLIGTPEEIVEQVRELKDIGIQYLIVNFRGKYNPKDKLTFAEKVIEKV